MICCSIPSNVAHIPYCTKYYSNRGSWYIFTTASIPFCRLFFLAHCLLVFFFVCLFVLCSCSSLQVFFRFGSIFTTRGYCIFKTLILFPASALFSLAFFSGYAFFSFLAPILVLEKLTLLRSCTENQIHNVEYLAIL